MSSQGGWIAVDLDGTLAEYHGWQGIEHIGAPIPVMLNRVKKWLAEGLDVRIFTARVCGNDGRDPEEVRSHIRRWLVQHLGVELPITNIKDFGMVELWDDRAVQVIPNIGERADGGFYE